MKFIHGFFFLLGSISCTTESPQLTTQTPNHKCIISDKTTSSDSKWRDMNTDCALELAKQVQMEVGASLTYLAMGAHFARDDVNRPGFSDLFLKSASEEREHAIKLLEYLSMRGNEFTETKQLRELPLTPDVNVLEMTGHAALKAALDKEVKVTASIKKITNQCETWKHETLGDYHLVDYLSGVFLEEQYIGQRDLAGKISTLSKMMGTYKDFGEFLFDKKLLLGEV